jgi:Holliday junction DNA helicase RuvA
VFLHVHTHVREDAIVLYGFTTAEERRCFEALLSAHGVGPSLALAVLCVLRPPDLVRAVLDEDLEVLCAVPGVGRKTAARLVLDLRTRLELTEFSGSGVPGGTARTTAEPRGEVRAALVELGYGPDEIRRALHDVPDEGAVEELLRQALRELASAR